MGDYIDLEFFQSYTRTIYSSTTTPTDSEVETFIELSEQSAPSTPSSGYSRLYFDTSGNLTYKTDGGQVRTVSYSVPSPTPQPAAITDADWWKDYGLAVLILIVILLAYKIADINKRLKKVEDIIHK